MLRTVSTKGLRLLGPLALALAVAGGCSRTPNEGDLNSIPVEVDPELPTTMDEYAQQQMQGGPTP